MKKRTLIFLLMLCLIFLTGCGSQSKETVIVLSDEGVTVDGKPAPDQGAVFTAHDIIYYEDRDTYDSGNPYGEGLAQDRHSREEAEAHTVIHITQPGTYRLQGTLSRGQIAVDLGKDAKDDPEARVSLVLDGVDLTCTVAPAVIFYRVFECDTRWTENKKEYTPDPNQDLANAGAGILLADGSRNKISGSYVAKIFKDNGKGKKLHKYDGAIYSKMSLNMGAEADRTGVLELVAENEGIGSELHLTVDGGNYSIRSQNDGINASEDAASVITVKGGRLEIAAGLGAEGDGIDSNGYLVISGGEIWSEARYETDSGLDSALGTLLNGGIVMSLGSTEDWADEKSKQRTLNLEFSQPRQESLTLTDLEGTVLLTWEPNRPFVGAVISCPALEGVDSCFVYSGDRQQKYSGGTAFILKGKVNSFSKITGNIP